MLDRLFIIRDNQDPSSDERSQFAELLEAIPSVNGRAEVLRQLAETFPENAHYWGHLGRLLSYGVGDFSEALSCLDRAIDLMSVTRHFPHARDDLPSPSSRSDRSEPPP